MNFRLLTAGVGMTLTAACPTPTPPPTVPEPAPVQAPCPPTTWSDWNTIPDCDLNGSQTWILVSDELPNRDAAFALMNECHDSGGVWAYDDYDVIVAYCIDIDY